MTTLPPSERGDGRRGRRLVIGLVTVALVLAVIASIYRKEAWQKRPTTVPEREGQVMR